MRSQHFILGLIAAAGLTARCSAIMKGRLFKRAWCLTVPAAIAGGLFLSSCSVKEDRSECPTFIVATILPQGAFSPGADVTCYIFDSDGICVASATHPVESYAGEDIYFPVAKDRDYTVTCLAGLKDMKVEYNRLTIEPYGASDPIVGFSKSVHVGSSDYGYVITGRIARHFADVRLKVINPQENYPFRFELRSGTSGLSLINLGALEGGHLYRLDDSGDFNYRTRIIRQTRFEDLVLDIYRIPGVRSTEEPVHTIALGEDLIRAGYDASAEDMEDIYVEVTYAQGGLYLTVNGWEVTYEDIFEI